MYDHDNELPLEGDIIAGIILALVLWALGIWKLIELLV